MHEITVNSWYGAYNDHPSSNRMRGVRWSVVAANHSNDYRPCCAIMGMVEGLILFNRQLIKVTFDILNPASGRVETVWGRFQPTVLHWSRGRCEFGPSSEKWHPFMKSGQRRRRKRRKCLSLFLLHVSRKFDKHFEIWFPAALENSREPKKKLLQSL